MWYRNYVIDVRDEFKRKLEAKEFVIDKTGVEMIEIIDANFVADENAIFGTPNEDYIAREIEWYESQSLNVNDIPGDTPAIWKQVATPDGFINSNYGWCIYSDANASQYKNAVEELRKNPFSRRASMIYTRPSMWYDYNKNGMSDFMCTHAVDMSVRDGALNYIVRMRSNDAWAGYRNDRAWHSHIHRQIADELDINVGSIYWSASSLHVYAKDFYLVDHYVKTGKHHITKKEYNAIYQK